MSNMYFRIVVVSAAIGCSFVAYAAVIYQWVDESGRAQMSDVVPEKYKKTAKRIDSRQFNLSPEERGAAEANAAQLKAKADEAEARHKRAQQATPPIPASAASARQSALAPNLSDCASWRKAFLESKDCFARHQTNHGPLRQGAYETCGAEIPNPEPKCGPEKWQ